MIRHLIAFVALLIPSLANAGALEFQTVNEGV